MLIKDISIGLVYIPLLKVFKTALRSADSFDMIVVKITTNSGIVGYGETAPSYAVTGNTKESILKALYFLKSILIGKDIGDFNTIINFLHNSIPLNFSAKSAIEIAIYDIAAQNAQQALFKYLGGAKKEFSSNMTISLNEIETMVQDTIEAMEAGFKSLKIKLGDDYKKDILRIAEINSVKNSDISLKVDANQGWSPKQSIKFLNEIEKKNIAIDFLEQPVERFDIDGLKYIKERTSTPIVADESMFSPRDAIEILEKKAADMINIKLDKCGGISKAMQIADICAIYDIKCMIGCMMQGAISVGAAAHVASAKSDSIVICDLDSPMHCKISPVIGGVKFNAPNLTLPKVDGLGIKGIEGVVWL